MTDTTVNNGQTVSNLDVTSGNFLDVSAGGTANNTTVESGGDLAVEPTNSTGLDGILNGLFGPTTGGIANGVTVNGGGLLDLRGSNSNASNITLNGGTLEVEDSASVTGSLAFGPTTGSQTSLVSIDFSDTNFKPLITGFSSSSAIEVNTATDANTLTTTMSNGNTVATVSGGGVSDTFTFAGTVHLMLAPIDTNSLTEPAATLETTNTTNGNAAVAAKVAPASAHGSTVSALQVGHAAESAMSFLSHPQAASAGSPLGLGTSDATLASEAAKMAAGVPNPGALPHAMTLPPMEDLASSMFGALLHPQSHAAQMTGFLSNPTASPATGSVAMGGALPHVEAATVPPALHIG